MSKLVWDATGEHFYETGVRNGVLYVLSTEGESKGTYPEGVVWNGLTAITEKPTGAEATALYADDSKYLNLIAAEEFEATVEAYTYPEEFEECDGSASIATGVVIGQQARKTFGLCYRTVLGNDVANEGYGYKLHMIYGAVAAPSEKAYATINDSPEAITFSWELKTTPVAVEGFKPTATVTVDSTKLGVVKTKTLEAVLYGIDEDAEFEATKKYAVGDVVMHADAPYVCTTAVTTPGAWSDDNWTEIEVEVGPRLPLPEEVIEICA